MLAARVATAIVGVPIILALVWLGGPPLWIVAALAAAVAARETANLLVSDSNGLHQPASSAFEVPTSGQPPLPLGEGWGEGPEDSVSSGGPGPSPSPSPRGRGEDGPGRQFTKWPLLSILGAAGLVLAAGVGPAAELAVVGLVLIVALALSLARQLAASSSGNDWSASFAAAVYAGLPLALLISMRQWPGDTSLAVARLGTLPRGAGWLLLTLTGVWAVDTVAYLMGRLVGRRRLWPRVSPNKTWEGTIAGVLAGVVVVEAWARALQLGAGFALGLGGALAVAAVLGDLAESALKRRARVKDAGALLPGHGGLLDRIDSLAFAAVVVFLSGILDGSAGTRLLF